MRFYFIRHAQSANNALGDSETNRVADPELTELGMQQAVALGNAWQHFETGLTHLYCSTMSRAIQTALEVGRGANLTPHIWEDWHETGGIWMLENGVRTGQAGKNRAELEARFPGVDFSQYGEAGWWSRPHEDDCRPRAIRAWQELIARHGGTQDRVGIVSHGHFYAYILGQALGLEIGSGANWFETQNTAVTRLDWRENAYSSLEVKYTNRTSHLRFEQVS
jgi:2,3-bisphosphoglycerate-dependent phosphoglycerate mutase